MNRADCVWLKRGQLMSFLQLDRFQDKRLEWLIEDLIKPFPYNVRPAIDKEPIFSDLYLSRHKIPESCCFGALTEPDRLEAFKKNGLLVGRPRLPSEIDMLKILAVLEHGIGDFDL